MRATGSSETTTASITLYDATSEKTLVFTKKRGDTKCKYYVNKSRVSTRNSHKENTRTFCIAWDKEYCPCRERARQCELEHSWKSNTPKMQQPSGNTARQPRGLIEMGCVYLSTAQSCSYSLHGSNSRALLHELSNIINTAANHVERKSPGGYRPAGVWEAFRIILGLFIKGYYRELKDRIEVNNAVQRM